jgi:hypothetical protein
VQHDVDSADSKGANKKGLFGIQEGDGLGKDASRLNCESSCPPTADDLSRAQLAKTKPI